VHASLPQIGRMRDHKSLLAWVEARTVATAVLWLTRTYWTPHATELFRQLQRAALSIQLNIEKDTRWETAAGSAIISRSPMARRSRRRN